MENVAADVQKIVDVAASDSEWRKIRMNEAILQHSGCLLMGMDEAITAYTPLRNYIYLISRRKEKTMYIIIESLESYR